MFRILFVFCLVEADQVILLSVSASVRHLGQSNCLLCVAVIVMKYAKLLATLPTARN